MRGDKGIAQAGRRENFQVTYYLGMGTSSRRPLRVLCELCGKVFNRKGRKDIREDRKENREIRILCLAVAALGLVHGSLAQNLGASALAEKIIIDTDVGDDIDDAFAVALALSSPELQILGITTAFGDTEMRARLLDRMLGEAGRQAIPVGVGIPTKTNNVFTQRRYAEAGRFARVTHPAAVD